MLGAKTHEYFSLMVSRNEYKYCNVINHRTPFFKELKITSRISQTMFLVLLQSYFKKTGAQFNDNNMLRNDD